MNLRHRSLSRLPVHLDLNLQLVGGGWMVGDLWQRVCSVVTMAESSLLGLFFHDHQLSS
jgi:hypothetical protein